MIYLQSFPKSGNTWLRIILKSMLCETYDVNINFINLGISSAYKKLLKLDKPVNMSEDEILKHRNNIYKNMDPKVDKFFMKVHDAFVHIPDEPLFPTINSKAIIIIRNPLDIVSSYANHTDISLDESVDKINNGSTLGNSYRIDNGNVTQHLGTWKENVTSWIESDIEKLIIRYEDLHEDFENTVEMIASFLDIKLTNEDMNRIKWQSDFKNLKQQEITKGFIEKPKTSNVFFREGRKDQYKKELSKDQIRKIIEVNKDLMKKFNYDTEDM